MANEKNLTPFQLEPRTGCGIRPKGAYASAESKRRRRTMREAVQALLAAPVQDDDAAMALLKLMGVENPTQADAVALAAMAGARKGDMDAARFVRDTAGERPDLTLAVDTSARPVDALDLHELSDDELLKLVEERSDAG
jgi:hypothetical protein